MSLVYQQPPKNYLYQVGLVNTVDFATTPVTRNGVQAAANLQRITIPLTALQQDGQLVSIYAMGIYNSTAAQTIEIQMNGNQILSSANPASASVVSWFVQAYLMRRGTSLITQTMCYAGMALAGIAGSGNGPRGNYNEFIGFNFVADLLIQFQVTSGNAGDTSTQHFITSNIQ